jgi:hypothetical protein
MRILYRRFFFATQAVCQNPKSNTWRKWIDNGGQRFKLNTGLFPNRHKKNLDAMGTYAARFYVQMNRAIPAMLRMQKGSQPPKGKP